MQAIFDATAFGLIACKTAKSAFKERAVGGVRALIMKKRPSILRVSYCICRSVNSSYSPVSSQSRFLCISYLGYDDDIFSGP